MNDLGKNLYTDAFLPHLWHGLRDAEGLFYTYESVNNPIIACRA